MDVDKVREAAKLMRKAQDMLAGGKRVCDAAARAGPVQAGGVEGVAHATPLTFSKLRRAPSPSMPMRTGIISVMSEGDRLIG
jgi:hypothetical protein